ncbi:glycogenin glucosyltransferase [Conoideocrella luteorostrata]|uniref:glycogenin glucosyltransferase n=1 Tax=Conoideocrella luteorostrata TaxID=1105319 RepID=A0AAJ0D085_9HYPO|nr:glycogenin glucosyltransferase [Conoideocrella luteorostrata]
MAGFATMSTAVIAGEQLYATLLMTDSYLPGALVLAHSLRDSGTTRKLAVLVTLDSISVNAITQLKVVYDYILPVARIRNEHPANLYLMNRSDLHSAFTKINLWKQTQFSKIVYMDADVVAYRAPDELFNLPHAFSAAPDIGWPDISNTGVMVLTPNMGDYYAMLAMAERGISFDGADQGLINMHFKHNINRLSFTYNVTPSAHYQYIPAQRHFQSSISMVHFIGVNKPWFSDRNISYGNDPLDEMIGRWWAVHDRHYRQDLTPQPVSAPSNISHEGSVSITHPIGISDSNGKTIYDSTGFVQQQGGKYSSRSIYCKTVLEVDIATILPSTQSAGHSADLESSRQAEAVNEPVTQNQKQSLPILMTNWDAQRQPPPLESKPEAINFPSTHYEMSRDTKPFVPPVRYPSPPKNMWYEVPKEPPSTADNPRHIFPWEAKQPVPLRSFTEPAMYGSCESPGAAEASGEHSKLPLDVSRHDTRSNPPTISVTSGTAAEDETDASKNLSGDPWTSFSRANAWDEVPEIGRYVDVLQKHRRTKSRSRISTSNSLTSPLTTDKALHLPRVLRVTDFPTEAERPSLPVTPAPIRGPSFWGEDKDNLSVADDAHLLPAAEGVPLQSDWDPAAQLQKLAQQQSEALLRRLSGDDGDPGRRMSHDIPARPLPFGSESIQSPTYLAQSALSGVLSPQPIQGQGPSVTIVEGLAGNVKSSPEVQPE